MSESRCFTAQFGGTCQLCGQWVERDSQAHMVNGKFAHDYCHEDRNGKAFKHLEERPEDFGYTSEREPVGYVVKGRRNHEKKCTCGLTHAGECP